jgi:hypothetical protein
VKEMESYIQALYQEQYNKLSPDKKQSYWQWVAKQQKAVEPKGE